MLEFGRLSVETVSGGSLRIDGGVIFGVAPRTLWSALCAPDENNRILLDTNCVFVQTPDHLVLIDTGYGSKATVKQKDNYHLQDGLPIAENLKGLGVVPADIDYVILTHLHFD